jgi:DNA-binding LacI/PurR family transcriptional regulator
MPKMEDIAKRAGVALSTVSHTLSGKRPVSEKVRQRVYQAIKDLEYQPNTLARALATKRTQIIALLYPTSTQQLSSAQTDFLTSIAKAATQWGYALLLWTSLNEDTEILKMTQQGFIDGIILMEIALDDPRITLLKERKYPFAMIGHSKENEGISFVDLDFPYAVHTSIDYLVKLGHQHIALINHPSALFEKGIGYVVRTREAFYKEIHHYGLEGVDCFCDANAQSGYEMTKMLLAKYPSITAFLVLNEWTNGGVLRALAESGLKVPDDVSLVAITSSHLAEMTTPTLTAVEFPFTEMGRLGAEMLIRRLEGQEEKPMQILLQPALTVRSSTGPCKR